jgi:hypothetical protein
MPSRKIVSRQKVERYDLDAKIVAPVDEFNGLLRPRRVPVTGPAANFALCPASVAIKNYPHVLWQIGRL